MKSKNQLIISRASNNIGDLFYYFVITIIFYKLKPTPTMLGALTISYLLPGIVFSYIVNMWTKRMGARKILLISDSIRAICIGLLALSYSPIILLMLVFIEQCFSISSSVAFDQYVAYTQEKTDLNKINGSIVFLTNLLRLALVPIYLMVSPVMGDRFFIVIDMLLTVLALVMIWSIPSREGVDKTGDNGEGEKQKAHFKLTIYHMAIVIFCLMCIERVAIDSYAIAFSEELWKDGTKVFSYITFITTLAFLTSSALATRVEIKNVLSKKMLMLFSSTFLICVVFYTFTKSMYLFIGLIGVSYFLVNYYHITMTSSIQREIPELTSSLMLFLTVFYNTISLSFVVIGAVIAVGSSMVSFFKILFGVITLFFLVIVLLLKRVEEGRTEVIRGK